MIYGLFTVPGDHKRYENYLVRWWIWVEEKRETGLPWFTAFLQVVTTLMTTAFDRVFGPRLISLEAVGASVGLSVGFVMLLIARGTLFHPVFYAHHLHFVALAIGIASLAIGLLRVIRPSLARFQWILSSFAVVSFASFLPIGALLTMTSSVKEILMILAMTPRLLEAGLAAVFYGVVLIVSVVTDFLVISLARRLLKLSVGRSGAMILSLSSLILLVGISAVWVPTFLSNSNLLRHDSFKFVTTALSILGFFNLLDLLVPLVIFTFAFAMLLHRLIWPPLGRLLQVIHDEHILLKRWPMFFTGIGILCVTWPGLDLLGKLIGLRSK